MYEEENANGPAALHLRKTNLPACFVASRNLGNPAHIDVQDGSHSFVIWAFENPQNFRRDVKHTSWLLFPDVGLAIELIDGVGVSWDGRKLRHCTSAIEHFPHAKKSLQAVLANPKLVTDTASLLGFFTAMPKAALNSSHKQEEFVQARGALRHNGGRICASGKARLLVGQKVWVRIFAEDGAAWRRMTLVVEKVKKDSSDEADAELQNGVVHLTGTGGTARRILTKLSM
eukprot:1899117-Pleurochrysis_carterae.AAC.3